MRKLLTYFYCLLSTQNIICYDLPYINLGLTNILDGGPIRPTNGWYFYQTFQYYKTDTFTDAYGALLTGAPIKSKSAYGITEAVYQSKDDIILNAQTGIDIVLPYAFTSYIGPNALHLTDSGKGLGDLYAGLFLQWHPINIGSNSMLVHRFEFGASFPCGKFNTVDIFNPGNGFYFINPYWAGTFYFIPSLAISWRLQYIWSAKSKYTGIQAGQAIFLNYSAEYEIIKNFWIAVNGYFLQQYTNSKIAGFSVLGSKERIFAVGPGALYTYQDNVFIFAHAYWESKARNRTQGFNLVFNAVLHF